MIRTLDRAAVRRAFSQAAERYEATAVLQHEVEAQLLERLVYAPPTPERVLDIGAGTGKASAAIKKRWRGAQVIAMDLALPMLRQTRRRSSFWRPLHAVCADAQALPIADARVDVIFSNLCLQWCEDLDAVFDECRRVLRPGGVLLFSTFGPDTLHELRSAWSAADDTPHVNRFADIAALGDGLMRAGFRDPVVDREHFVLTYRDAKTLMRELKTIGAHNAAMARARGLTGRARFARVLQAYENFRVDDRLPATYEVIYGMAFAPPPGQPMRRGGGEIATFSVEALRGSRVRREPKS